MQTILTSVLSNRANGQNATPSSDQTMLATHTESATDFAKAFDEGSAELAHSLVAAPQENPAKAQDTTNPAPDDNTVNADMNPDASKSTSPTDGIDVQASEIDGPPHLGRQAVPPNSNGSVDRQIVAQHAPGHSENRNAALAIDLGRQPSSTSEKDNALALAASKHIKIRHQSVAAALVNGVAHQSEMTKQFDRSAHETIDKSPRSLNRIAEAVTLKDAQMALQKPTDSSAPMPVQSTDIRRVETVQDPLQMAATTRTSERVAHLDSHLVQEIAPGVEKSQINTQFTPKAQPTQLAQQPSPQPPVPISRGPNPPTQEPGHSESHGQNTIKSNAVLSNGIIPSQTNHGVKHEAAAHRDKLMEVSAKNSDGSARSAASEPKLTQDQPAPPVMRTEPQSRVPTQVPVVPSPTRTEEMHPRAQDRNTVAAPTAQPPEIQSPTTVLPTAKPIISATVTKMVLDTSATYAQDPVEEVYWDLRPQNTPAGPSHNTLMPHRHEMPGHIAQQLAQAMQRNPDRPVEIALNPAELGRVRMTLTPNETGIVVNILADRPETLDLMRRNINDLSESFTDLGYEDIAFAFGQNENPSDASDDEHFGKAETLSLDLGEDQNDAVQPADIPRLAISADGIDMRL